MHTRLVLVALACAIANTQAASHGGVTTTVVEVVVNSTSHTTLEALVKSAGLVSALEATATKFTLFAPTDDAFKAVPAGDLKTKLTTDPVHSNHKALLQDVLKQHVISATDRIMAADLPAMAAEKTTLSPGNPLTVKAAAPQIKAGAAEAKVVTADISVGNGVVHVIDKVLLPASCSRTVVGIATGSANHKELVKLLTAADLVATLSIDTPKTGYTVFAPTDEAFAKLDKKILECLAKTENKALLANLLKYHVVGSTVVAGDLTDKQEIGSLDTAATKYTFSSSTTTLTSDGKASKITATDLLATNGVVHIIDTVLIPKGFVCPAASSASSSASYSLASVAFAASAAVAMFY